MLPEDGWRFSLDDFPAAASSAGPIKTVLEWILPKTVLAEGSFQEIAAQGRDYRQTVFRLPLRLTLNAGITELRGPIFPSASFPHETDRSELLRQMCDEASRSLLFLKSIRRVVFGGVIDKHFEEWACVEATRLPSVELEQFVNDVHGAREGSERSGRFECSFRCEVSLRVRNERIRLSSGSATFQIVHLADFTKPDLAKLVEKLRRNDERAVPWVAIAVPLDGSSFDWEGVGNARWRVFLPLAEEGPSTCIMNAAVFVDPSRRAVEFRTEGSDETLRKSQWNRTLVEQLLGTLLREASATVIDKAPQLIEEEPKKYLSLFPIAASGDGVPASLADVVRASFCRDMWLLKLHDLWKEPFDVWVGPGGSELRLEKVAEWLVRYKGAFKVLRSEQRRFVAWNVGDAVGERLGEDGAVEVGRTGADVADRVLLAKQIIQPKDLLPLLKLLGEGPLNTADLQGRWAVQREGDDGGLLRYDPDILYLARTNETPPIYETLDLVGIFFGKAAEWVVPDVGLCALAAERRRDLTNVVEADDESAVELLRRGGSQNRHDLLTDHFKVQKVVGFLCSQSVHRLPDDLRLAFLIKTAAGKVDRRNLGVIFLRPETPTPEEEAMWQGLLREAFAEVDPQFAVHLRRLLAHAPRLLACLDDDDCKVRFAQGDLLDLLHVVRTRDKDFIERTTKKLNQDPDKTERRAQVYRAARLLLREAERRWDSMEQGLRECVLELPIHRTATGDMVSLILDREIGPEPIPNRFFLQSEDDLRDAPLQLRAGQLLHSLDPDVRSFYRHRLGIREHGRIEVLKECLVQVGTAVNRSRGLLKYIARYYFDAVEKLRDRGGEGTDDLHALEQLHATARGIPCLDGSWRSAAECVDATRLRSFLGRQGWKGQSLDKLLCQLNHPKAVAEDSSDGAKLARNLWEVHEVERDVLAELAIASESPGFSFADRVRVIADNLALVPEKPPARAANTNSELCEALGPPVELQSLVLIDPEEIGLANDAIRVIVPEAADLRRLAARFTEGRIEILLPVLRALGVPKVVAAALRSRILVDFAGIWARLGSKGRLALLAWLGGKDVALPANALNLDTVLVGEGDGKWVSPASVIAPSWASPAPPNVPATSVPRMIGVSQPVLRLWDRWCGLRDLDAVVGWVVRWTREVPCEDWPVAAKRLVRWLDEVAAQKGAEAIAAALCDLAWVPARRREEFAFQPAYEVLDHAGAGVLEREFWVVAERASTSLMRSIPTRRLNGSRDVLEAIARSLTSSSSASPMAAFSVYELLVELTSEEQAYEVWRTVARSTPVYRLFRNVNKGRDRVVSGLELFLGDLEVKEDFGEVLYCLGTADDRRKSVRQLYRKLGIEVRPSTEQLVAAVSRIPRESSSAAVYGALVDAMNKVAQTDLLNLPRIDVSSMKVRSCAKTYEPLSRCFRDHEIDRSSRLSSESRERMIDTRDSASRKLIQLIESVFPGLVLELRSIAVAELTQEPDESQVIAANVLDAWRDWLAELAITGSVVRTDVEKVGFTLPADPVHLCVVPKVHVRFHLPDGHDVTPSDEWGGPELFHDSVNRLFVRRDLVDRDFVGQAAAVEGLDGRIVGTLEDLLRRRSSGGGSSPQVDALLAVMRDTLDRPGAVLKRMREEKQEHFFHQYLDQTADREFSNLFDSYRRTSSSASERRRLMAQAMWDLISLRFVDARRNQIRGHGYDEFAIFAELIQNAEDAYSQREQLDLPQPPQRGVWFAYSTTEEGRTLAVKHYGRPFNLWRYGSRRVDAFRYDVEGVLKSAGSFKPHSRADGARPIGRFGLGFKSVYLVTDAPRIHSGDWHFEITAACIPNEVAVPADYEKGETVIVLPLVADAREERDGEPGRYANMLPFLRNIGELGIEHSDGTSLKLKTTSRKVLRTVEGYEVDRVEIGGTQVGGAAIRLLRVRCAGHEGQLGILLGADGLPVSWSDALGLDVFAVLPLKVHLDCGVGVSNLFEVQSGRTHMIDPATNMLRFEEVAKSLPAVAKALIGDDGFKPGEVMSRFWALWRWDRGDEEARPLRVHLAKELARLSRTATIVPTLDPECCVKFNQTTPLFCFDSIPDDFANELLRESVEFPVQGTRVKLHKGNVVPNPIRSAVEKAYAAANDKTSLGVSRIGWSELGEVFLAKTWLVDRPSLVSAMARSLPEEKIGEVRPWLGKCLFRASNGQPRQLSDLLPPRFPGAHQLPSRLIVQLDESYDEEAISLLKEAGLPARPPLEMMKLWVRSGLEQNECLNLLHYLAEAARWRRDYYDLGQLLTASWFDSDGTRLSTAEAFRQGLVPIEELDPDPAFRAWLGIETGAIQVDLEEARWDRPIPDPQRALGAIWEWWSVEGDRFVRRYDERTYPDGELLKLDRSFSPQDTVHRQNWILLLILASLQTMGRSNPEQHRNFLRHCARQGWMDVFADARLPADEWMGVLDEYLGAQTYDIPFYHWVRQFVSIYQIARWLPEYVWSFLSIDKSEERLDLDWVTQPAMNPDFAGGGPSAPPLTRTLGIGACFVVRELVRAGVLQSEFANDHAYVAVGRVRYLFARLGMTNLEEESASYRHSRQIYDFLVDHLGRDRAHFNRCFDLPFLAIAEDSELQKRFLDCQLPQDDEERP
jgi:hypothetical protein